MREFPVCCAEDCDMRFCYRCAGDHFVECRETRASACKCSDECIEEVFGRHAGECDTCKKILREHVTKKRALQEKTKDDASENTRTDGGSDEESDSKETRKRKDRGEDEKDGKETKRRKEEDDVDGKETKCQKSEATPFREYCARCGEGFTTNDHMVLCSGCDGYYCDFCAKSFATCEACERHADKVSLTCVRNCIVNSSCAYCCPNLEKWDRLREREENERTHEDQENAVECANCKRESFSDDLSPACDFCENRFCQCCWHKEGFVLKCYSCRRCACRFNQRCVTHVFGQSRSCESCRDCYDFFLCDKTTRDAEKKRMRVQAVEDQLASNSVVPSVRFD